MRNITVAIDDDLYRRARVRAAERRTSLSRIVAERLRAFASGESDAEVRTRQLIALFARVDADLGARHRDRPSPNWREEMYAERFGESVLGRSLAGRSA